MTTKPPVHNPHVDVNSERKVHGTLIHVEERPHYANEKRPFRAGIDLGNGVYHMGEGATPAQALLQAVAHWLGQE